MGHATNITVAGATFRGLVKLASSRVLKKTALVPWARLQAPIEAHHAKSGKVGRPPIGELRRLRMCFLQQWKTLAVEDML